MTAPAPDFPIDEATARQLVLLRACETVDNALWTTADRDWATRVARASLDPSASPARLMVERCRHAMQRLGERDRGMRALIAARVNLRPWMWAALFGAPVLGLALDQIGPTQQINLLAPPIWALVAWNLVVMALVLVRLLVQKDSGWTRRLVAGLWRLRKGRGDVRQRFVADWLHVSAPLDLARAALVLHLAAAGVAVGLLGGMYGRGLVLDYRAGWQSTFLDPPTVDALLGRWLAPASAVTGIEVPGTQALAALRVDATHPATGPAAPWLHLYAATLGMFVIAPRLLLALGAGLQVWRLRRRLPLPLGEAWYRQWLNAPRTLAGTVWLLPHAAPLPADAALRLQAALDGMSQGRSRLVAAAPVPYGDEGQDTACTPPPGTVVVLLRVDLSTTPEAEVHGTLLDTLGRTAASARRVLLVDAATFRQRFGEGDARETARRRAWERLAEERGAALLLADLRDEPTRLQAQLGAAL